MTDRALDEARAALRARQGAGARYDDAAAPGAALLLARQGTAYFARLLGDLRDADFTAPSGCPGWSRAALIAHLGYHARALATCVETHRHGHATPKPNFADDAKIVRAATLPPEALRHLFHHSAKHLDVEWRDLDAEGWGEPTLNRLPLQRACEIWQGGVLLATTGRPADIPAALRDCTPRAIRVI